MLPMHRFIIYLITIVSLEFELFFAVNTSTKVCPHTGVSRQVEHQAGEKREQHAGNDDVDDEVERQPQHQEVVSDVEVWRLRTAGVVNPVLPAPVVL